MRRAVNPSSRIDATFWDLSTATEAAKRLHAELAVTLANLTAAAQELRGAPAGLASTNPNM